MDNLSIAENFDLLAKLMELYDEDNFKVKAYQNAARMIKNAPVDFEKLSEHEIYQQEKVGKAIGSKIIELLHTGSMTKLEELISNTPAGIIEMMTLKGIGIKKIKVIWKELNIVTIEDLLIACKQNILSNLKGFGEKSQKNIEDILEFYFSNKDSFLLATVINFARYINDWLRENIKENTFLITGDVYQQNDIVKTLQWISDADENILQRIQKQLSLKKLNNCSKPNLYLFENGVRVEFIICATEHLQQKQFEYSCDSNFLEYFTNQYSIKNKSEHEIFHSNHIQYIPPFLRNNVKWIERAKENTIPSVIETDDIKGIIHSHSNWSDGGNTLEEIVLELRKNNFDYLVITDHSQSAFYANGLKPERIIEQHAMVDLLNEKYPDFKIFKGIECDILNDGKLDYANEVLKLFDVVIASVHSNLRMSEEHATERVIKAIENPYTNILGHMTGRLLLIRSGYPIHHEKIIDACAANSVVIELNANPRRLDIDWKYIDSALEKNVLISINPDAHNLKGLYDIHYGVLAAQKAALTKERNLSSFNLKNFEIFLDKQKSKRPR